MSKFIKFLDDAQIITGDGLKILKVDEDYLPFLSETKMLEKFQQLQLTWVQ